MKTGLILTLAALMGAAAAARGQTPDLAALDARLARADAAEGAAEAALVAASAAMPRSEADVRSRVDALKDAEVALAQARADYLGGLAARSPGLSLDQLEAGVEQALHGGTPAAHPQPRTGHFHEPAPLDFNDHEGFVNIFDGQTLKGWDGDPNIWHVEDGAIVGVSTLAKPPPNHNSYISYHGIEAHDFDLKMEIKTIGRGGSGIQYRSAVNLPWTKPPIPGAPPPNLAWMMTGPQADFWPPLPYSGQFYSENTPLGIVAWRGEVVNSGPGRPARLVGLLGDRTRLGTYVMTNGWNRYEVIARGPTMIHIINGRVMAVEIDDDPASSNNSTGGLIGIEIESAPCRVYARDIWLRKLR